VVIKPAPEKMTATPANRIVSGFLFAAAVGLYDLVTGAISIQSDVRYNQAFQFGEGETSA
jgi:hypothetical protein